ncbi:MAG: hypothetical protein WD015_07520 [Gaiellaceae bacterium]
MHASDTSFRKGHDASAACSSATCTQSWTYDACERVTHESSGVGSKTKFTLDVQGNATQEVAGSSTTTPTFAGQQL